MGLLWQALQLVVIGFIAGWLASRIFRERRFGFVAYVVIGIIGAFIGQYIFRALSLPLSHFVFPLLAAVAGTILLFLVMNLFRPSR
jgi:uncharacterized membrane protein YeaQ/YmgE (transglycosylase-associated protein family)